jgi:ATP-dependent DNA helicase RecQ
VAILTNVGAAVMRGERPARLLLPPEKGSPPRATSSSAEATNSFIVRRQPKREFEDDALDPAELVRFEALRAYRLETARAEGVPPYVVASDRALRDLSRLRPERQEDLTLAHGIGEATARKYGDGFLRTLREVDPS